ncbi:hypothetical protein [Vitiosangium sp. GDMCC 1.1324]|uniref:hypothetical protein n=1 Tax=Vitiosangium sp. (strain GDMCC 1.1324) TaxID=2138576 RepID=UPI000D3866C8|nr:hypothetical protein [Vitiosangium sp. GDMCC 1.1324]PTL77058.1 hypothetical protein DAT35_46275 [Vitiosangium sp. GDMCC 1.1324]
MNAQTLKCLSLVAVGFGFAVGCGGSPEDTLPGEDATAAEGTVSAQACPIDGCIPEEKPVTLNLKCVPNYPFVGLEITNTSATTAVPAGATIKYTAKYLYHSSVTGTASFALAKGQTKTVWVDILNGDDPVSCTATATWYL